MPLILKNFSNNDAVSGIWKILETEAELLQLCNLNDYDKELLKKTSSSSRRLEILAVRAIINELELSLSIKYKDGKPICSNGYISISHSKDFAVIVWHQYKKLGVDIEKIDKRLYKIAERAFSEEELLFANKDLKKLCLLWNCKECVFKLFDNQDIEFKAQIKVMPFEIELNDKIICEFYGNDDKIIFELSFLQIEDNTLVWGIDN
ncbi:4'-phosphopantetheinyl transferase superfamily protein [Bacteroidales bacterium OttesenSCG-928-I21]|nr:4'-phosphopantetheinyl transferase superfamily protein [Bacteroidales bacterium OttesenSCG-928-I21]